MVRGVVATLIAVVLAWPSAADAGLKRHEGWDAIRTTLKQDVRKGYAASAKLDWCERISSKRMDCRVVYYGVPDPEGDWDYVAVYMTVRRVDARVIVKLRDFA